MRIEPGIYVKLKSGRVGLVADRDHVQLPDGQRVEFTASELDGYASWDEIDCYRREALPGKVKPLPGQQNLGE